MAKRNQKTRQSNRTTGIVRVVIAGLIARMIGNLISRGRASQRGASPRRKR